MKRMMILFLIVPVLFLGGCSNSQLNKERIYKFLEEVVALEENFANVQQPFGELEANESQIFAQIMEEPASNKEGINKLSTQGIEIINKKKELLAKERESILQSKKKFEEIDKIKKKTKDEKIKKKLEDLQTIMQNRYNQYEQLYTLYTEVFMLENDLYQLFKSGDITIETLENQIKSINDQYTKIQENNAFFNDWTRKYNDEKLELYNELDIEVKS